MLAEVSPVEYLEEANMHAVLKRPEWLGISDISKVRKH